MTTLPTATDTAEQNVGVSRRTIVAGAAWAVPAIVAVTATPALAAASGPTVSMSTPGLQAPAAGTVVVSAVVRDAAGVALAGQAVSFTGPSGTSFSPSTATTNSSGVATSTLTTTDSWATPGSRITATAVSNGVTGTAALTVLGANAYLVGDNRSASAPGATSLTAPTQLQRVFPSPIVAATSITPAGVPSSFVLLQDGSVWSIGDNAYGQLGDGTTTARNSWAKIASLTGVVQIVALEGGAVLALLSDGTLRGWGTNGSGELNDGTTTTRTTPITVGGLGSVQFTQLTGGGSTVYALAADGTIRAWGSNGYGQGGNGTMSVRTAPVTVSGITTATRIAAGGDSAYALLNDGTIRSWGYNGQGQLGNGSTTDRFTTPVTVSGISTAIQISASYNTGYALLSDGTLRSWGFNNVGQLGNGSTGARSTPITVYGITTAARVAANGYSAYALLDDGTLRAWGSNSNGQLGNGTTNNAAYPVAVAGASNVTTISTSGYTSSVLLVRGSLSTGTVSSVSVSAPSLQTPAAGSVVVSAIARNAAGARLGGTVSFTGPAGTSFSPSTATINNAGVATSTLTTTDTWATPGSTVTVTALSNGVTGTASLTVLGANAYLVGNNSAAAAPGATSLTAATQLKQVFPSPIISMSSLNLVSNTTPSSFALLQDGTVWSIGDNSAGQLGDGTTSARNTWAKVPSLTGVSQIVTLSLGTVIALLSDGTVRGWGNNRWGQLNDGTTTSRFTPVTISGLGSIRITQLAAGQATVYALGTDGTVRAWGYNGSGQVGNGTTGDTSTPVTVSGITTATQIAANWSAGYALLSNGTIRSWGSNSNGELGDGTATARYTPVTVSGVTTATQVTGGFYSGYVRLNDGTIRAWGFGSYGQLGNGATANTLTPVTVSGVTTATRVATNGLSAYAQLADGTTRAWGQNTYGQLGDGTTTDRSTPVTLTGGSSVTRVSDSPYGSTTYLVR